MTTLGYRYTEEQRRRQSEGRRAAWAKVQRGPGLERLREASAPGECPFCGDPVPASDSGKPPKSCGEPECEAAYFRYYQRDRRAKQRAAREVKP